MSAGEFEQLLLHVLAPDNDVRQKADDMFTEFRNKNTTECTALLLQMLSSSSQLGVRRLAAVLLRQMLTRSHMRNEWFYAQLTPAAQEQVRSQLVQLAEHEQHKLVHSNLCDCISELAVSVFTPDNPDQPDAAPKSLDHWPQLMPFLLKLVQSENALHRRGALIILGKMCSRTRPQLKPHRDSLMGLFNNMLADSNVHVRVAAMAAVINSINGLPRAEVEPYQPLLQRMIGVTAFALQQQDEEALQEALQLMVDLADLVPTFLRPAIVVVFQGMMQLVRSDLDSGLRHLALEAILVLCERKPSMMRKVPNFVQEVIPTILKMMSTIEDNDEWNLGEKHDIQDEDKEMGEESIDRLALFMRGETIAPVLFSIVPQLLNSAQWRERYAGVMAISTVGEGCVKFLKPRLGEVLKLLLPHFEMSAHPRVRWAALNCAGQMSTDFAPVLQEQFADPILTAIVGAMHDVNNPRVQAHAASAVINFCDNCKVELIQPYLDVLLTTLLGLLSSPLIVQEQAVTAIAAVATCISSEFTRFYKAFREPLLQLLSTSLGEERHLLRGKTMECVSLIAVAVGKEVFGPDAEFVMKALLHTQNSMKDDDPQVSYVLKAWVRICRCLGKDFVPFLPTVIKPLLECAARKPDIRIFDRENAVEDNAYNFLPVEDKVIAIKTAALEEKATACSMLNCYAEWLEDGFMPFVGPTAEVLVPLQGYYYSDTVRSAATSTMPCLMRCVVSASKKTGQDSKQMLAELWGAIAPQLVKAIGMEVDPSLMVLMLNSLHECMDMAGPGELPGAAQENLVDVVESELEEFMERRAGRDELRADPECDELERERIDEEDTLDEQLVQQLTETVGKVFKYQGKNFLGVFGKRLVGYYIKFLESDTSQDRTVAYCVFDDLIEHAGTPEAMQKLLPMLLPRMLQSLHSEDPDERQAAVYGLGVASRCGQLFVNVLPQVLQGIGALLSRPDAREPSNVFATENAASALAKIIKAQAANVNVAELLPQWLSFMPLTNDEEEGKVANELLCEFLEQYPEQLLGPGASNLVSIFNCFGTALDSEFTTEELTHRIVLLTKQLHQKSPRLVEKAISELDEETRQNLIEALKA